MKVHISDFILNNSLLFQHFMGLRGLIIFHEELNIMNQERS
jgi:hypothetical protein